MNKPKVFMICVQIGQGAFLAATISHVAYYFSAFDSNLIIAYGLALSIDGFIALMSYAVIDMVQNKKGWFKVLPVASVVALLSVLSIYINVVYNRHFENIHMLSGVSSIEVPIFGDVNSLIASCFSFLILAYTFVGNAISDKGETLEAKVARLKAEKELKQELAKLNKGRVTNRIKSAIASTVDIAQYTVLSSKTALQSLQDKQDTGLSSQEDEIDMSNVNDPKNETENVLETLHDDTSADTEVPVTMQNVLAQLQLAGILPTNVSPIEENTEVNIPALSPSENPKDTTTDVLTTVASNGHTEAPDDFTSFINMIKQ